MEQASPTVAPGGGQALGSRLRELRQLKGLTLRQAAAAAGVNHGYLSQVERGQIAQPSAAQLGRLAAGYGEPTVLLLRWAGYLPDEQQALSSNQARVVSYLGGDVTAVEVEAVRAVLAAVRQLQPAGTWTPAAQIVLELANAAEPVDDDGMCVLCIGRMAPVGDLREYIHAERCPWRLARAWLGDQEGWPGPATPALAGTAAVFPAGGHDQGVARP